MSTRRLSMFVIPLTAAVWMLAPSSPAQQKEARPETKWEYRALLMSDTEGAQDIDKALNELGSEGWELATSNFVSHAKTSGVATYVLKRPKR